MLLYKYCVVKIQEQIKFPFIVELTCTTEIGCNLENDLICVLWLYLKEYLNEQHWAFSFKKNCDVYRSLMKWTSESFIGNIASGTLPFLRKITLPLN